MCLATGNFLARSCLHCTSHSNESVVTLSLRFFFYGPSIVRWFQGHVKKPALVSTPRQRGEPPDLAPAGEGQPLGQRDPPEKHHSLQSVDQQTLPSVLFPVETRNHAQGTGGLKRGLNQGPQASHENEAPGNVLGVRFELNRCQPNRKILAGRTELEQNIENITRGGLSQFRSISDFFFPEARFRRTPICRSRLLSLQSCGAEDQ